MLKVTEVTVDGQGTGVFEAELTGIGKVRVQLAPAVEDQHVSVIFSRDDWSLEVTVPSRDVVAFAQRALDVAMPLSEDVRAAQRGFADLVRKQ